MESDESDNNRVDDDKTNESIYILVDGNQTVRFLTQHTGRIRRLINIFTRIKTCMTVIIYGVESVGGRNDGLTVSR